MKPIILFILLIMLLNACNQDKGKKSVSKGESVTVNEKVRKDKPAPTSEHRQSPINDQEQVTKAMPPVSDYEQHDILGWHVMVSPNVTMDELLHEPILVQLKADLAKIHSVVPKEFVGLLQKTTIWVEQGMPIKKLNATFFNGGKALTKKHGLVPESYGGVIIGNTKGYLAVVGIKPWQLLHELTHAFHQFVLKHSYAPVQQAYTSAMAKKLFHPSSDKRIPRKAYATKNQKEYLSVLSEIYFGEKIVYPRNRSELAEHDPEGYCAVVQAWGLRGKQRGNVPLLCHDLQSP